MISIGRRARIARYTAGIIERMKYKVPDTTKRIVIAVMQDTSARSRRRASGNLTEFDKKATAAIEAARKDMVIPGCTPEMRDFVTDKIIESITRNRPWEKMGETYCCRQSFYYLRVQYIYHVAVRMEIINGLHG